MNTNNIMGMTDKIKEEISKVIIEQQEMIELCIAALYSGGHILIEGMPGLAKTLFVRTLAKILNVGFKRIQFTPDMLPADIIGTKIFNMQTKEFVFKKGPIFSNIVLADEINRTPAKTQAGLLEAMEEETVSVDGITYNMPSLYMVLATQNPIEYEGTYSLPEALVDRFLFKIKLEYPSLEGEIALLKKLQYLQSKKITPENCGVTNILDEATILKYRENINTVNVEESLYRYMVDIVRATRENPMIENGSSPRGYIALLSASKAIAAMSGRDYIIPEDIKKVALPSLRHRIILKPEVELDGVSEDDVIRKILDTVKVPR